MNRPSDTTTAGRSTISPVSPGDRLHTLDVLRGVAILGILFVNIEYMKGPDMYRGMAGTAAEFGTRLDAAVSFTVGWLVAGKFLSILAILFGIGAGLLLDRAGGSFEARCRLVRRRYRLLILVGLAHMLLLFPGDILFVYGIAGLVLVRFARLDARRLWRWSVGLLTASAAAGAALAWWMTPTGGGQQDPLDAAMQSFLLQRADAAKEAFVAGSYLDVVVANAWEAAVIQMGQLLTLPWIVGLFVLGLAVARSLRLDALRSHRRELRLAALVGLGLGLPANLLLAPHGAMAMSSALSPTAGTSIAAAVTSVALVLGAPLLAVGYLASCALALQRGSSEGPIARVGRVALSAYLLQSLLSLVLFAGLGQYDRLTTTQALLAAIGIAAVVVMASWLWLRSFRAGPVEWLWRSATYRRRQPLR